MFRVIVIIALAAVTLQAQEKADDKPKAPKLADVIRENENLKRENAALKHDLQVRDSYIQLEGQRYDARSGQLQQVLTALLPGDDDKKRCETLEVQLREADKVDKDQAFDCKAMTFAEKKKQ